MSTDGMNYPDHFYADAIKKESPSGYRSTKINDHESTLRTALSYINHARSLILEELDSIAKPIEAKTAHEEWAAMNRSFRRDFHGLSNVNNRGPDKQPCATRTDELPPNLVKANNPLHHITLQIEDYQRDLGAKQ